MRASRLAGVALLAMMAFAAVARADEAYCEDCDIKDKEKMPKKIIIVPKGELYADKLKGKPEPKQKVVFLKNNTMVHKEKLKIKPPKIKEQPIKDFTKKQEVNKQRYKVEFIKNNTKVYKQKLKIKPPQIKEKPIQDFTKKQEVQKQYQKIEFIKNNTKILKPIKKQEIKVKELPIKDITKPYNDLYKGMKKEEKEQYKYDKEHAYEEYYNKDYPSQDYPSQDYPSQYPGQEYPGQEYPGQEYPGQETPGQEYPGQEYPGQEYPGQENPGQEYPGEEYPEKVNSGSLGNRKLL